MDNRNDSFSRAACGPYVIASRATRLNENESKSSETHMSAQTFNVMQRPGMATQSTAAAHHAAAVKQTQKWVSQTFFGTMLKQMRNSPFKSEMFEGGRGGQAFQEMYDQQLADHMARGAGKKLVNSIVRKIEGAKAYRKSSWLSHNKQAGNPSLAQSLTGAK
jgi:Rod binding domain-containing protein